MSRGLQHRLALGVTFIAGSAVVACMAILCASYVTAVRHAPANQHRLKELELAARSDFSREADLAAERARQTQLSLDRDRVCGIAGHVLLVSAISFLISMKSRHVLGRSSPPIVPLEVVLRAAGRLAVAHHDGHTVAAGAPMLPPPEPPIDLAATRDIIVRNGRGRSAAVPILQAIQSHYGYLPETALQHVCAQTDIAPAQIAGVASFYDHFRTTPAGRHVVRVCHGTACHVAGAELVHDEIRRHLRIPEGADTDAAREFTVEKVACMGCCTLAPVASVDGATRGHLAVDEVAGILDDCLESGSRDEVVPSRNDTSLTHGRHGHAEIRVGLGSCCVAGGSGKVYEALQRAIASSGAPVQVKRVGCVGMCHRTPLVEVLLPSAHAAAARYALVRPQEAVSIIRRHFRAAGVGRRVWHGLQSSVRSTLRRHSDAGEARPLGEMAFGSHDPSVAAFLDRQKHIATEHCGELDPTDFDEYVRHGGFSALRRCLHELSPMAVLEQITASGLRGRGGAGFSTGAKWALVEAAPGDRKVVICNGDEGDPGAFMDRMLMESFPFRIIEGLAIAARAVGAHEGTFYIRAEYPLAVRRIRDALRECERRGLLGASMAGSGYALNIEVMEGAGAFVCGEETALLASIEGQRGTPRLRPPFPAQKGLHGLPTLINNVETLATVPWIIRHGADAFAALGTATSKGTKVFALAGKIRRGGLIEVPMGITVREIIEEIGGGTKDGRRFKAVQIGGPSGGCIPAELADLPVDYEALGAAGAIMGSGGLVVMDAADCMVDIARYFLAFTQEQSCGKCTYCRVGTRRMLDILERICSGQGRPGDLEEIEELAHAVRNGSLCGLGKTAPNPVLTTLRYFRDEYEAHLAGRCPAGKCKALIRYRVLAHCTGCTLCAQHCGADAIAYTPYRPHLIDDAKCTRCGVCLTRCPEKAIAVEPICPN